MKQLWVNLAVSDLSRTKDFFTQLGFSFEPKYTDEKAACLIVNLQSSILHLTSLVSHLSTPSPPTDTLPRAR